MKMSFSVVFKLIVQSVRWTAVAAIAATAFARADEVPGDGLSAVYFNNAAIGGGQADFTGAHVSRVEPNMNLNWNSGSPDPSISATTWSARFSGEVYAPYTGTYIFGVNADDGERLWVNDQPITNRWSDSNGATADTGTISLVAGKKYHIVLEYYQDTGGDLLNLQWQTPADTALSTIPTDDLYSMNRQYPASGSGVFNVVGDYGAVGDGITDDTTAIQNAINAAETTDRPIYFPSGTYRVTNSLTLGSNLSTNRYTIFQGQNRDNVVIKLDNSATGFGSASSPKNFLSFYDGTTTGGDAFRNAIYDMTFDAGSGNPGATAVRFFANNQGGLENVTIRAESSGLIGLDLTAPTTGPNLFENVLIDGFATGVEVGNYQYGADFDKLTLQNQTSVGVQNFANVIAFRGLQSRDSVTAIYSTDGASLTNVLGSTFTGGASGNAAIVTNGPLVVQDSTQSGYGMFVQNTFNSLPNNTATSITDYVNTAARSLFGDAIKTLHLPVQDSPDAVWGDPSQWVRVSGGTADDTSAIQTAINTANTNGKSVVYFNPTQTYTISNTIVVSGGISRLFGGEATFEVTSAFAASGKPMFLFQGLTAPSVTFDRFGLGFTSGNYFLAEQNTSTPLVLSHFVQSDGYTYKNDVPGTVFFNDVSIQQVQFNSGLNCFARQFNTEDHNATNIINNGANAWILGVKTESPYTVLQTSGNGQSELFGGLFMFNSAPSTTTPGISTTDSHVAASWAEGSNETDQIYTLEEQEARAGVTNTFSRGDSGTYYRGDGSTTGLYVANGGTAYTVPNAPSGLTATVASTSEIDLGWTDNSNNETGFKVEVSLDQANWMPLALTAAGATTFADTGLASGTTYYYRVRATNSAGDSANSTANATTQSAGPTQLSSAGWTATATGLQWGTPSNGIDNNTSTDLGITQTAGNYFQIDMGTTNTVTQIVLSTGTNPSYIEWNYIGNYSLQISPDGTNWTTISTGQGSYSVTTISLGSGYTGRYLRMTVTNANSNPWRINEFSVYGTTSAPTVPAAPSGLTATAASSSEIDLSWTDNSTNETGFKVERSIDQSNWTSVTQTAANVTTYADKGLSAGTTYYYRVRATNSSGDSANTTANGTTQSASGPTQLSSTGWTATATGVQWGTPSAGIDNDTSTDFGITQTAGNYFQIDMGTNNNVTQIVLSTGTNPSYIEWNYIGNYDLQISSDGTNWTSIATGQGSYSVTTILLGSGYTGRYLRMTVTNANSNPWRINEFSVYGTPAAPPTPAQLSSAGWTATATGVQWGAPSSGIDNNTGTDFGITQNAGNYFQIDMGTSHTVTQIVLTTGTNPSYIEWNYIGSYNLQISTDGTNWTTISTGQGSYSVTTISLGSGYTGRYLRMTVATANSNPWRINEFTVTGY